MASTAPDRERLRAIGRRVVVEQREALDLLAAYDRGEAELVDGEIRRAAPGRPPPPTARGGERAPVTSAATVHLGVDDVIALHAETFGLDAEEAAARLRDPAVLAGALARPQHHARYGGADLAAQAAVLAQGIAEGQAFVDGNKRTALVTLCAFLAGHGLRPDAAPGKLAAQVYRLSDDLSSDDLALWLRGCLVPAAEG